MVAAIQVVAKVLRSSKITILPPSKIIHLTDSLNIVFRGETEVNTGGIRDCVSIEKETNDPTLITVAKSRPG